MKTLGFWSVWIFVLFGTFVELAADWNSDFYHGVVRPATSLPPSSSRSTGYPHVPSSQKRVTRAILFAVNEYDGKMDSLSGCINDIERVREWLQQTHDIHPEHLEILTDRSATYANLDAALKRAAQVPSDRLVVVIACHGGSAHGKSFICPQDMLNVDFSDTAGDDVLATIRERRLFPLSDILAALKALPTREILLILDSCRKVEAGSNDFMQEFQELMHNDNQYFQKVGGSFAVVTSCSFGQQAEEYSSANKDYGKFLYFFTEGLTGKADFTGCYDNSVTLTEAYNYAYAQMEGSQTPEIFMASSSGNMVLANYADLPRPTDVSQESDLAFLLRTGVILSNVKRWNEKTNREGLKALDCVLENVPNNALACSVRGSVHRRLGNYEQTMLDWSKVGHKLQLYAGVGETGSLSEIPFYTSPDTAAKSSSGQLKTNDLLTVSGIRGDFLLISEVNNAPVTASWVKRSDVHWNYKTASERTTATQNQRSRDYSASYGNATPMERMTMRTQPSRGGGESGPIARGP
ncbi:MAG: caspase family protein [Planctomycetia bacterium]|nr:caspase family protein [Planctomycetia bacterium]